MSFLKGGDIVEYVLFFIALAVSFIVGTFGFCQIIGSLQTRQRAFLFTIVVWVVILAAVYFALRHFLPDQMTGCYIGAGLALLSTLKAGKIQ